MSRSKRVAVGGGGQAEVLVELGRHQQLPHLLADSRQLRRIEGGHLGVLVEQLLQAGHLVIGVGAGHRREKVVDDGGVGPTLGLGPLARVVDDEGVDERDVAQGHVGEAAGGQAHPLAGQPFERPVLARVHDGVGAPYLVEPPVEAQVVVGRRQVRRVVHGHRLLAEAPGRLHGHQHPAEIEAGEDQVAAARIPVDRPGGVAPGRLHRRPHAGVHPRPPGPVDVSRQAARGYLQLGRRQGVVLVGEGVDQLGHEGVAAGRDPVDPVAGGGEGGEQGQDRRRGVEGDGVADPAAPGRVGGQHDGHPPLGRRG